MLFSIVCMDFNTPEALWFLPLHIPIIHAAINDWAMSEEEIVIYICGFVMYMSCQFCAHNNNTCRAGILCRGLEGSQWGCVGHWWQAWLWTWLGEVLKPLFRHPFPHLQHLDSSWCQGNGKYVIVFRNLQWELKDTLVWKIHESGWENWSEIVARNLGNFNQFHVCFF